MANNTTLKIQQLTEQYRKQIAVVTASEKDPKAMQAKIKKLTEEYQKSMRDEQYNEVQKSKLSEYSQVLSRPHSKMVVEEGKNQKISPEVLNDLMKHPEKHTWSDWLLASEALYNSGALRQAYFAWSVFKVLGFAVAKTDARMDIVKMGAEKRFGKELIKQITQDLDIWGKLFRESIEFCKKLPWDNKNPGAKVAAVEFYEMNQHHFSAEGIKKLKTEREKNKLPEKKLTEEELGPELPKAWIL